MKNHLEGLQVRVHTDSTHYRQWEERMAHELELRFRTEQTRVEAHLQEWDSNYVQPLWARVDALEGNQEAQAESSRTPVDDLNARTSRMVSEVALRFQLLEARICELERTDSPPVSMPHPLSPEKGGTFLR